MTENGPWRVFVIDDDEMFSRMLTAVLDNDGRFAVVGTAVSVGQGLAGIEQGRPDILLLDHRLPDALGAHAAKGLRSLAPAARVVVLSGGPTLEDFVDLGVDCWVDKAAITELPDVLTDLMQVRSVDTP